MCWAAGLLQQWLINQSLFAIFICLDIISNELENEKESSV